MVQENEKDSRKNPAETFSEIFEVFGKAISEIFQDPELKEKAREFGKSTAESAKGRSIFLAVSPK